MKTVYSVLNDEFYEKEMARAISDIESLVKSRGYTIEIELGENKFVITPKNVDLVGVWFGVE